MWIVKVQEGRSMTISIPKEVIEKLSINKGDKILVTTTKDNKILLEKIEK